MATSTTPANYYYRKSSGPITKKYYEDAMNNMANFNLKLASERKMRLPYLDYQTRIAQNHSQLWMSIRDREPGKTPGQIYSYPQRLWKKSKHQTPSHQELLLKAQEGKLTDEELLRINIAENPYVLGIRLQVDRQLLSQSNMDSPNRENSRDKWYIDDFEELDEPLDAGEIDDPNTDSSDFEDQYAKKKKKKTKPQQPTPKIVKTKSKRPSRVNTDSMDYEDKEKPYKCESCGARYKTRAGLHYHLNHYHAAQQQQNLQQKKAPSPPTLSQDNVDSNSIENSAKTVSQPSVSQVTTPQLSLSSNNSTLQKKQSIPSTSKAKNKDTSEKEKAEPNDYCDFCLGDCNENKQTGSKEELVSCADCGRAGHPSCLQFTKNMIISVKKYNWQCIECKSCGLCGTSDNDDQLLFCDDCDRGYHMYCLDPPLTEPPEGSWSCHLCLKEFHMEDKNSN